MASFGENCTSGKCGGNGAFARLPATVIEGILPSRPRLRQLGSIPCKTKKLHGVGQAGGISVQVLLKLVARLWPALKVNRRSGGRAGRIGGSGARSSCLECAMERPSLTPLTFHEFDRPSLNPWAIARWFIRRAVRRTWHGLKLMAWTLIVDLRRDKPRQAVSMRQLTLGIAFKLALFVPVVMAIAGTIVHLTVYPAGPSATEGVRVFEVFSERVGFASADGTQLSALWIPAVQPSDILDPGADVLRKRYPTVILAHDYAQDARQMTPMVQRLHDLGCHVLAVDLRGAGQSETTAQTFGRLEQLDIAGAVSFVARRPTVDEERIIVWGVGTGGIAARSAVATPVPALVVDENSGTGMDGTAPRFLPQGQLNDLLQPLCRWTFDFLYAGGPATEEVGNARRIIEVSTSDRDTAWTAIERLVSNRLVTDTH